MNRLRFPFWIVTRRYVLVSKPLEADELQGFIAAFSSSSKAAQYVGARDFGPDMEIKMIARATMPGLIADMEQLALVGMCVDQQPDGTGGRRIGIGELKKAFG